MDEEPKETYNVAMRKRMEAERAWQEEQDRAEAAARALEAAEAARREQERKDARKFKFLYSKDFWAATAVGAFWVFVGAVVLGIIYLIIMGISSDDTDSWTQIDDGKYPDCYVHEIDHNNGWLTPGHNWTERQTYCMAHVTRVVPE
jgi:hypothetical protein